MLIVSGLDLWRWALRGLLERLLVHSVWSILVVFSYWRAAPLIHGLLRVLMPVVR